MISRFPAEVDNDIRSYSFGRIVTFGDKEITTMRIRSPGFILSLAVAWMLPTQQARAAAPQKEAAFVFNDVCCFHRWSKNDQHEFTPEKREDLEKWADMIRMELHAVSPR